MKKTKNSKKYKGCNCPFKCKFCNHQMYDFDDIKQIAERTMRIIGPANHYKKFYVHLKCWKAGLTLIKGEVLDGIFIGLDKKHKQKKLNNKLLKKEK